ncbi:hypothetical protein PGT21_028429 [Puccinia graminis f. sp. tritici]|uniref:Kinetochore protein Spc24 n=1 Tax=Puccinia graminis f. sp. tritici TaxID=56615 RepID=A0A5B0NPK7_PUCGR|nr:hypothetical protein PGTUg99_022618 [Puccinia graminis f. sp. tritici]KAA1091205.1 hypothetical protein PGT21_028429 [Puccinia graminis f. sp. tritici]
MSQLRSSWIPSSQPESHSQMRGTNTTENEAGERSMDQHQTAADEPPSQSDIWMTTLVLAQDMAVVLKEGVEEEVGMMYEALDQTFKWNERRRERVENAHNELLRVHRQVEAKKDALEKMKANSTARENQAEIYSLDQSAYEEARKIKGLDYSIGSVKARTTKLQTELDELEQSEPTRSPDFVIESSVLKTKLYHDFGFVQVRTPLQEGNNSDPEKLFIRCDSDCTASRVVQKPKTNRDGFTLANEIWDAIS